MDNCGFYSCHTVRKMSAEIEELEEKITELEEQIEKMKSCLNCELANDNRCIVCKYGFYDGDEDNWELNKKL